MGRSVSLIFESLFGCHHSRLSRVFTIKKRTYRVCFECGREIDYSWELMHSQRSVVAARPYAPLDIATQVEASASRSCCPGIAA
jgi:hypothetical protein